MASRNAYDVHHYVYDLHRKFGSEMAAESSQKIDGENPSLSGIRHAARAFSLSARRGGPCMAKRVLKMAIRCLPFDRSMSTMQLQSSVCQRIGNTASFFCQHSMHIFIKIGRSGPDVAKMTTFCLYMAAGSVV